jgi:DNA mismatch repair ATPase MutS
MPDLFGNPEPMKTPSLFDSADPLDERAARQFDEFKAKYPDYVLLFRLGTIARAYQGDARHLANAGGTPTRIEAGRVVSDFPYDQVERALRALISRGLRAAICEPTVEHPCRTCSETPSR